MKSTAGTRKLPRAMENGHILLWLIKDTCWAMEVKWLAITMILPTVSMAFYLFWQSRKTKGDAIHNAAVCFWILANTTWMIGEFMERDWRPYAVVLFAIGLLILAVYYVFVFPKERGKYEYVMVEKDVDTLIR